MDDLAVLQDKQGGGIGRGEEIFGRQVGAVEGEGCRQAYGFAGFERLRMIGGCDLVGRKQRIDTIEILILFDKG